MKLLTEVEASISQGLAKDDVRLREGPAKSTLEYLSGPDVALALNEAAGPMGWDVRVDKVDLIHAWSVDELGRKTSEGTRWCAFARATVTVTIRAWLDRRTGEFTRCRRQDIGHGTQVGGSQKTYESAVEQAEKSAVTDALKRAARFLGPQTGFLLAFKEEERQAIQDRIDVSRQTEPEPPRAPMATFVIPPAVQAAQPQQQVHPQAPVAAPAAVQPTAPQPQQPVAVPQPQTQTQPQAPAAAPAAVQPTAQQPQTQGQAQPQAQPAAPAQPSATDDRKGMEEVWKEKHGYVGAGPSMRPASPALRALLPEDVLCRLLPDPAQFGPGAQAVQREDANALHAAVAKAHGQEAALAMWPAVGVQLGQGMQISREQIERLGALLEALPHGVPLATFLAQRKAGHVQVQPQPPPPEKQAPPPGPAHAPPATITPPKVYGPVDEEVARQVRQAIGQQEDVVLALAAQTPDAALDEKAANVLHSISIERLQAVGRMPSEIYAIWHSAGFEPGVGTPTVQQGRLFVQALLKTISQKLPA